MPTKHTTKTTRAISAYGFDACLEAYRLHLDGNGASTIASTIASDRIRTTRQADSAINAGREISDRASVTVTFGVGGVKGSVVVKGLDIIDYLRATDQGCYSLPKADRITRIAFRHAEAAAGTRCDWVRYA